MEKQKIFTFEQQKELFKNSNNRVLSFDSVWTRKYLDIKTLMLYIWYILPIQSEEGMEYGCFTWNSVLAAEVSGLRMGEVREAKQKLKETGYIKEENGVCQFIVSYNETEKYLKKEPFVKEDISCFGEPFHIYLLSYDVLSLRLFARNPSYEKFVIRKFTPALLAVYVWYFLPYVLGGYNEIDWDNEAATFISKVSIASVNNTRKFLELLDIIQKHPSGKKGKYIINQELFSKGGVN